MKRPPRELHSGGRERSPRDDAEAEVRAELESHFAGTVDLLVARGWREEDARREALRRFGDPERHRAALTRLARRRRRRARVSRASRSLVSAAVAALRSVARTPGLSAAVVATLALGIGANAAVFRVADRLLLSPPQHVVRPSEVVRLHQTMLGEGEPNTIEAFTYPDVRALRESGLPARFAAVALGMPETLGAGEAAARVRVARADSAFLPLVGVEVTLGRTFAPSDHRPDAVPVALLAHHTWVSRFGSDPGVLGRTLRLGEGRYQVVGILPDRFVGTQPPATDVWLPLEVSAGELWGGEWSTSQSVLAFRVLARVGPAGSAAAIDGAADVLRRSRGDEFALRGDLVSVGVSSLVPGDRPEPRAVVSVSRWLVGVALLVLGVACANVANLFLAQGERTRRETAVRLALGAAPARIGAELLMRTLVLASLGAAAALLVTAWSGQVLDDLFLAGMELGGRPRGGRMLGFVALAAVAAAVLSAIVPAALVSRRGLRTTLAGEGRGSTGATRLRWSLVTVQAALSALLLVGALLFVLSLRAAVGVDLGFDHERLLMVRIEADEGAETPALWAATETALSDAPGVASISPTVAVPFVLLYGLMGRAEGSGAGPELTVNAVGGGFLATMGVPLLRGRDLERGDLADGADPVAVVDSAAAARLWPGEDALGRCVVVGRGERPCARVVGVAGSHAGTSFSLPGDPRTRAALMAWVPLPVAGRSGPSALMVRTEGRAAAAVEAVRRRALEVPGVRYAEVEPMTSFVDRQSHAWRLGATVFSLFGAIALGVAVVGLYGVLSYEVVRRRREIGIRMALGARPRRVWSRVTLSALATVAAGLGVALPLAAWGAGRLGPLLFDVSPREPVVFAAAAAVLLTTALFAATLPAWRATRVSPREALSET